MRRWILYAAVVLLLLALAPVEKTDIGQLIPVELLYVYKEEGKTVAETDTGCLGRGANLEKAIEDLHATAEGELFLETADYLIVTKDTQALIPELGAYLRPGTQVCLGINMDAQAAAYLAAHSPQVTMNDIRAGKETLPVLVKIEEGRYCIAS